MGGVIIAPTVLLFDHEMDPQYFFYRALYLRPDSTAVAVSNVGNLRDTLIFFFFFFYGHNKMYPCNYMYKFAIFFFLYLLLRYKQLEQKREQCSCTAAGRLCGKRDANVNRRTAMTTEIQGCAVTDVVRRNATIR